jgi:uncharacterized protein YjbI with pentapeptide repeats
VVSDERGQHKTAITQSTRTGGEPAVPHAAQHAREATHAHPSLRVTRHHVEELIAAVDTAAEVNLERANMRGIDLSDLDLSGIRLAGAQLQSARLISTILQGAALCDANLEGADLHGAILTDARLERADLSGAHLDGASLQAAYLTGAHLAHARLDGARLRGAHFENTTLWGASLHAVELDGCHFEGADLHDADLFGAFFAGSTLADADLALTRWRHLRAGEELAATHAPLRERPEAYRSAADAYRRLRQACTAQGLYDQAGEIYRREMRMRQRALGSQAALALLTAPLIGLCVRIVLVLGAATAFWTVRGLAKVLRPASAVRTIVHSGHSTWLGLLGFWRPAVGWLWHVALDAICGYGERVGRVLIVAALVILGMAFVYLRLGQLTEQDGTTVTSFWHALYFSACSFTSIGYAAFAPNAHGWAKWLGVVESFTGNFLLALFLVTFTRKLTR